MHREEPATADTRPTELILCVLPALCGRTSIGDSSVPQYLFEKTKPKATWRKTHRQYISTHIATVAPIRNPNTQNKPNSKIGKMQPGISPLVPRCLDASTPCTFSKKQSQSTPFYIDSGVVPSEWNESRELHSNGQTCKTSKICRWRKPNSNLGKMPDPAGRNGNDPTHGPDPRPIWPTIQYCREPKAVVC